MKRILSISLLFISAIAFAETPLEKLIHRAERSKLPFSTITFKPSISQQNKIADSFATDYTLYSIANAQLQQILSEKPRNIEFSVSLSGTDYTMKLTRVNLQSTNYRVTTSSGESVAANSNALYYQGVVNGTSNSLATISIFENDVVAIFSTQEKGNFVLGKIGEANGEEYVLYNEPNLKVQNQFHCGTDESNFKPAEHTNVSRSTEDGEVHDCRALLMYYEANYQMYHAKANNATTVQNFINAMFNNVKAIYYNEYFNVLIDQIYIWTTQDSYSTSSSNTALSQFTQAQGSNMNGRAGQLLAYGSSNLGGIAWLDVMCNSNAVSFAGLQSWNNVNFPTYSWNIEVMTHELGHNIASPHTHGCYWNGNNTAIDGCAPTYDPSYAEGSCPTGPIPSNGGTIMSYCHLVSVGINFSLGFGPQPGDLIRQSYASASCITTQPPFQSVLSLDTNEACAGSQIYMEVNPTNDNFSYDWYKDGDIISSVTNSFDAGQSGTYYCITIDSNDCQSVSNVTTLNFVLSDEYISAPTMPLCGGVPATLSASSIGAVYLWNTNDTTQSVTVSQSGTYSVTVTDVASGCSATVSRTIDQNNCPSGIAETNIVDLTIYPNPTDGILTVESAALENGKVQVIVYDITGKEVLVDVKQQGNKATLSTNILASGVYVLHLNIGEQTINHRFVKF